MHFPNATLVPVDRDELPCIKLGAFIVDDPVSSDFSDLACRPAHLPALNTERDGLAIAIVPVELDDPINAADA